MAQPRGLFLLLFLLLLLFFLGGGPGAAVVIPPEYDLHELPQPPELLEEPPPQLVVFPSDDVIMKCAASGNPPVQYQWIREGEAFDAQEQAGVWQGPEPGTLQMNASAAQRLQGAFRCRASNRLGTALSRESRLIAENTPQWPKEKVTPVEVEEGDPVVLPCDPPKSAVPPKIYWLNSRIVHIAQDLRVSMGQDGFLYFANARVGDSHPDYICHAHYLGPRTIIQKEPLDLRVTPSNSVQFRRPRLLVPREPQPPLVALRGETLVLECIAEGLPTPWVRWTRLNAELPARAALENFNKTLRLREVREEDEGEYRCEATNGHGRAAHSHRLTVQAAPYWLRRPQSGVYGPGESARLECRVGGKPRPLLTWSINGVPLADAPGGARWVVRDGALLLPQLLPNDSLVAQCQAHNPHGHLLANAFVHVVELPVRILEPPQAEYEAVVNGSVLLPCRAFGTPTPTLQWLTPSLAPALLDERVFVYTNGSLRLAPVGTGDAGAYTCLADNGHSNATHSALLHVRAPTRLLEPPRSVTAKKGQEVTFSCVPAFDPHLAPTGIEWRRDGHLLPAELMGTRYEAQGQSLRLPAVDYSDQGTFTCRAWTLLDSAEASAELRVVGRPGPPQDLQVEEVGEREIELSWTPGEEHNSPVEKFVLEAEEQVLAAGSFRELLSVPGGEGQPRARLRLAPSRRYRFRVRAANAYGRGEASQATPPFSTPPAAPEQNPGGVKGEGNETNNLVITWEPLPPEAWNAPEVLYRVQWRPLDPSGGQGGPWQERILGAPPLVVPDTPTYAPYQLRVQAVNEVGKGPEPPLVVGYSGEDLPLVYPENVGVEIVNSSSVRVEWSLQGDPKLLRGRLRGFRVLYWREGWVGGDRSRRHVPPPPEPPPQIGEGPPGVLTVSGEASGVLLGGLRPWSRYRLRVLLFNGRGDGPPSDEIPFQTPEGVPGPPEQLVLERAGEQSLALRWRRPRHPNGILRGFLLQYRREPPGPYDDDDLEDDVTGDDVTAETTPPELSFPPGTLNTTLGGLHPRARYRFLLRALTAAGAGPALQRLGSLRPPPAVPLLGVVEVGEVGEDFTELRWSLARPQPDLEFEVQFQSKSRGGPWLLSGRTNSSARRFRLGELHPGTSYRVQFVGRGHGGESVPFWQSEVQTNGTLLLVPAGSFATQGWFIGLVSAAVLLLLLLLILCFIKRSKGGKYSVKDKEDTQGDSEARPMKDETFGEYSDGEEKASGSSVGAAGTGGGMGSDDSLAGYGGSGDVQFNEDGSFIGQYSGARGTAGSSGPNSPGTAPPLD